MAFNLWLQYPELAKDIEKVKHNLQDKSLSTILIYKLLYQKWQAMAVNFYVQPFSYYLPN